MMLLNKRVSLCAALAALAAFSQAVPLTPNAWTALPGITTIPGTVLQDVNQAFSFSAYGGTVSGSVQSRVTQKADGTLLFEWRVTNDRGSAGAIQDFRLGNFFTDAYDGDWESAGLGTVNPSRAFLFTAPAGDVNFNFTDPNGGATLQADTSSFFFYLNTDATKYDMSGIYDLTNVGQTEISSAFKTFAPMATPEPAPFAALGVGLLAVARRRKK
jgi:MYXO-CTERM domain-containing protein